MKTGGVAFKQKVSAEALQLAAALTWAGKQPRGHAFVCLDRRLRDAARKEGFLIMPPWTE